MKALFVVILLILSPKFGEPGIKQAQYSYAPSVENCVTEGFPYAKAQLAKPEHREDLDIYMMFCMGLDEEESSSPDNSINAAIKFWNGEPRR